LLLIGQAHTSKAEPRPNVLVIAEATTQQAIAGLDR
jgi:hypothetical protein